MPFSFRNYCKKLISLLAFALITHFSFAYHETGNIKNFSHKASLRLNNEDDNRLIKKYAELLNLDENQINKFLNLYKFIDEWMGTKYKWGGCSASGIDCSCFIMKLFDEVFDIKIKRTTFTQFYDKDVVLFRNKSQFQLGDLVFFKTNIARETRNNTITHVGMYLANGFFVQSSSAGVNIANLNKGYWKNCFVAAGRLNEKFYKNSSLKMPLGEVEQTKEIQAEDLQNSDFEPIPYPEDLDDLKLKYAELLQVDVDKINFPEIFDFIDKNRYAPYNITKNCQEKENRQSCFLKDFFKEVLNLDLNCELNEIINLKYTAEVKIKTKASALDFILIPTDGRMNSSTIIGLYLYNNRFLQIRDNEVLISSLKDSAFENKPYSIYRVDQELIEKGYNHVIENRRINQNQQLLNDSGGLKKNNKDTVALPISKDIIAAQIKAPNVTADTLNTEGLTKPSLQKSDSISKNATDATQMTLEEKRALEREQIRKEVLEKLEKERIEEERITIEKAERKRIAEEKVEASKAEQKRKADELAEKKRVEQERIAIEKAERKRIADEKAAALIAEQKRKEDELAEKKRVEQERIAIEKAERKKIADEKAAALIAEQKRKADELAEKKRVEQERIAIEKAERKKIADEKAAALIAEQKRKADELAEKKRVEQERIAVEKAERKKIADEKAAALIVEQKRKADELAEKKRVEQERIAVEKAERKRIADEKAAALIAEQKRKAEELAEKKRLEQERIAFEKAERKRIADEKAEAARQERLRIVKAKADSMKLVRQKRWDNLKRKDSIANRAKLDLQYVQRIQAALKADTEWKAKKKKEEEEELERIRLEEERVKAEKLKAEQEAALLKQQEKDKKNSKKNKKKEPTGNK